MDLVLMKFKQLNRLIFIVIMSLSMGILTAQSVQPVQVVEYRGRDAKQPLSGVSVTVHNAAAAISDEAGALTLTFRTLHAGDKVQVRRIERLGYEIFNKEALDQWTISNTNTFRIVLCESARFRALCDQYQQQASDNYAQQYRRDQERLAQQLKDQKIAEAEYQQQLAELEDEYNQQLDNLDNYVERFARIDLETLSEDQRRIIEMVQQGRFEEAIAAFESADYLSQYARVSEERQRAAAAAAQLAQIAQQKQQEEARFREAVLSQIKTYELVGGRENHQKSYQLRKALVDADTTDVSIIGPFLIYLQEHNHIAELEHYSALYLRQIGPDLYRQHVCYKLLAVAYEVGRRPSEARVYFEKTIEVMRQICQSGGDAPKFLYGYAESIIFLMQNYLKYGEEAKAEAFIPEADSLLQRLLKLDPSNIDYLYLSSVFSILKAESIASHEQFVEALAIIDDCIARLHRFVDQHSVLEGALRKALNVAFNIADEGNLQEQAYHYAEGHYQLAKQEYEKDPAACCVSMFSSSNNFGLINTDLKKYDEAMRLFREAEEVLKEVENVYRQPVPLFRFCLHSSLATLYEDMGQPDQIPPHAHLAVEAYDQLDPLVKENPDYKEAYEKLKKY